MEGEREIERERCVRVTDGSQIYTTDGWSYTYYDQEQRRVSKRFVGESLALDMLNEMDTFTWR